MNANIASGDNQNKGEFFEFLELYKAISANFASLSSETMLSIWEAYHHHTANKETAPTPTVPKTDKATDATPTASDKESSLPVAPTDNAPKKETTSTDANKTDKASSAVAQSPELSEDDLRKIVDELTNYSDCLSDLGKRIGGNRTTILSWYNREKPLDPMMLQMLRACILQATDENSPRTKLRKLIAPILNLCHGDIDITRVVLHLKDCWINPFKVAIPPSDEWASIENSAQTYLKNKELLPEALEDRFKTCYYHSSTIYLQNELEDLLRKAPLADLFTLISDAINVPTETVSEWYYSKVPLSGEPSVAIQARVYALRCFPEIIPTWLEKIKTGASPIDLKKEFAPLVSKLALPLPTIFLLIADSANVVPGTVENWYYHPEQQPGTKSIRAIRARIKHLLRYPGGISSRIREAKETNRDYFIDLSSEIKPLLPLYDNSVERVLTLLSEETGYTLATLKRYNPLPYYKHTYRYVDSLRKAVQKLKDNAPELAI